MACELCEVTGDVAWQDRRMRVVLVDAPRYPGFCRVIWNAHVREMTDLCDADRMHLLAALSAVERAVREVVRPDKINLASLGNVVPHLHWHVIPRWQDDAHFPNPIWGEMVRPQAATPAVDIEALRQALGAALGDLAGA